MIRLSAELVSALLLEVVSSAGWGKGGMADRVSALLVFPEPQPASSIADKAAAVSRFMGYPPKYGRKLLLFCRK